jgi:hypothetical protein
MAESKLHGKLGRVGFHILLADDGTVSLKGGSHYLDKLMSGMFGMSGPELAARVTRVRLLFETVDDSVLRRLILFPALRNLIMMSTPNVTPAGLGILGELRNLESLSISGQEWLTDDHLRQLHGLAGLRRISIRETKDVTAEAVASLKESLPGSRSTSTPTRE